MHAAMHVAPAATRPKVSSGMRAVVLEEVGGPEALVVQDVPEPVAEAGQSVVEVRAAGINFLEVLVRQGRYPQAPDLPWIPGIEVAGMIDGRRVIGLVRSTGGGYAERVVVDDDWLFDLPESSSFEEGAAFLMAFLTAWIPLTRIAPVRPGARVLVTAAAGGTGSAAVQVARLLGAEVVAAAGRDEKLELARRLGAQEAIRYDGLDGMEPVDVVFDLVGGELFEASLARLRPLGVAVAIGFAGGWWRPLDPSLLVGRNIGAQGFYLGRLMRHRPEVVREGAEHLVRLWRHGLVHPVVGATYPLEQVGDAHRLIEDRNSTGKVVLLP
jgi:NADPH:quinone reductase